MPMTSWNTDIAVNLTANFLITKHLVKKMKQKGWGRIIYVCSAGGIVGSTHMSGYCSAKAGVIALTKVVALETAEFGVTCNSICPGPLDTPMLAFYTQTIGKEENISAEEKKEAMKQGHPSKKFTESIQIANYVVFLCSKGADNMPGTAVPLDGGWSVI